MAYRESNGHVTDDSHDPARSNSDSEYAECSAVNKELQGIHTGETAFHIKMNLP